MITSLVTSGKVFFFFFTYNWAKYPLGYTLLPVWAPSHLKPILKYIFVRVRVFVLFLKQIPCVLWNSKSELRFLASGFRMCWLILQVRLSHPVKVWCLTVRCVHLKCRSLHSSVCSFTNVQCLYEFSRLCCLANISGT